MRNHTARGFTFGAALVLVACSQDRQPDQQATADTAAEMIAWAKGNPGKLTLATNGEGGYPHLAFELLASMAGFKFLHIPYKGSTPALQDLTGKTRRSWSSVSRMAQAWEYGPK